MYFAGIDYHKRYSFVSIIDAEGEVVLEQRVDHRYPRLFEDLFSRFGEPVQVVYESSPGWCWLYQLLEPLACVDKISLANPYKVRLIAEAQIKTDKLDARTLAVLLRADLVPCCYIPSQRMRDRKEVLRQRAWWVKQRTAVRNRIHTLLGKQHDLQLPQVSDLFGAKGKAALHKAVLREPDATLLRQNLSMLDTLDAQVREAEVLIRSWSEDDAVVRLLRSIPGVGLILSNVIAAETGPIRRFSSPTRYTGYAGLAPTTRASGGRTAHGRMMRQCNKWLKWAYIEAAWVAIGCSSYFGALYRRLRQRGKRANTAITAVARRFCHIVWHLLSQEREYQEHSAAPAALGKD